MAGPKSAGGRPDLRAQLAALGLLAEATGEARTPEQMADASLDVLVRTTDAAMGVIATIADDRYRLIAQRDVPAELAGLLVTVPPATSSFGSVIRRPSTVTSAAVADMPLDPIVREMLERHGVGWLAVVGLHSRAELSGFFALGWHGRPDNQPSDEVLVNAATTIAATIDNARLVQALAASEARYRALFDETPIGLVVGDLADGRIVAANAAAEHLYGVARGALVGRSVQSLSSGPAEPSDRPALAAGSGQPPSIGLREDGSTFPCEISMSLIELGGRQRTLSTIRDLSEQQRLQQELVQAQKMDAIGQLVSGVAHELNNPLAAIIGFSELIRRDETLPDDLRQNADMLVGEADRTRRIVQSLLDFARQRPPERHPTPIRPLVQSILDLTSYSLTAAGIEATIDVADDVPLVPLDRSQLQQVLLNLTTNAIQAIRASGEPGTLRFSATRSLRGTDAFVRLAVHDDGPGIAADDRPRLFMPFFTTKPVGEGTGLGLSVSFGIIEAHGGRLWHEPGPDGRGSTFVLELPVEARSGGDARLGPGKGRPVAVATQADGSNGAATRVPSAIRPRTTRSTPVAPLDHRDTARPAPRPDANGDQPLILVLDDEPSIRTFVAKALRAAGFEPLAVEDGPSALEAVRDRPVMAILCDHRMAGMSGTDVYVEVARIKPDLANRFVLMSGDVLNPELTAFASENRVTLLPKPFQLATVATTVRAVLGADQRG